MQNTALQTAMHIDYDPLLLTRRRVPATCGELVQGSIARGVLKRGGRRKNARGVGR